MHSTLKITSKTFINALFRHHTYIIIGMIIIKPHTKRKFYKN